MNLLTVLSFIAFGYVLMEAVNRLVFWIMEDKR